MNTALLVGGLAIVAVATVDALWTILWVEGRAGPFTKRVTGGFNAAFVAVFARFGHQLLVRSSSRSGAQWPDGTSFSAATGT